MINIPRNGNEKNISRRDNVDLTGNWAGVGFLSPPSKGDKFTSISGTFTVPTPTVPDGQSDKNSYGMIIYLSMS